MKKREQAGHVERHWKESSRFPRFSATPTMTDFFSDDIDFDRAASAFPDISLDGSGDIPIPAAPPARQDSGFAFDFDAAPPARKETAVKVTGDDEIDKFESEFPDIDVPVSSAYAV